MAIDKRIYPVALTIYGEARSLPVLDRMAVGLVIRERYLRSGWWTREKGDNIEDDTWEAACRDPWQFTCWQDHTPAHRRNLQAMLHAEAKDPKTFAACYNLAEYVVKFATDRDVAQLFYIDDPNGFPTHYYRRETAEPSWVKGARPVPVNFDSVHLFYCDVEGTPKRKR